MGALRTCGGALALLALGGGMAAGAKLGYVANGFGRNLSVVDLEARRTIRTLPLFDYPAGVAMSRRGDVAYAASGGYLERIPSTLRGGSTTYLVSRTCSAAGIAVGADDARLYVPQTCRRDGTPEEHGIAVADASTLELTGWIALDRQPTGIAVDPSGQHAYVTDCDASCTETDRGGLVRVDLRTESAMRRLPLDGAVSSVAVAPDGTRVYASIANLTPDGGGVVEVDPEARAVVATVPLAARPQDLVVHPDGNRLFVANQSPGSVSVIDTATRSVESTIQMFGSKRYGREPSALAIDPAGSRLYVLTGFFLVEIDLVTGAETEIAAGFVPRAMVVGAADAPAPEPPFPSVDPARCDGTVGRAVSRLVRSQLRCHLKAARAGVRGRRFDRRACEERAVARYDSAVDDVTGCRFCLADSIVDLREHARSTFAFPVVNLAYCEGESALYPEAFAGAVPPDAATLGCENGAVRAVGKLAAESFRCARRGAGPACDATALARYDRRIGRLSGCPACVAELAGELRTFARMSVESVRQGAACDGTQPRAR